MSYKDCKKLSIFWSISFKAKLVDKYCCRMQDHTHSACVILLITHTFCMVQPNQLDAHPVFLRGIHNFLLLVNP